MLVTSSQPASPIPFITLKASWLTTVPGWSSPSNSSTYQLPFWFLLRVSVMYRQLWAMVHLLSTTTCVSPTPVFAAHTIKACLRHCNTRQVCLQGELGAAILEVFGYFVACD